MAQDWIGICGFCGKMQPLSSAYQPWFRAAGRIVECPGCHKYIVRQECEEATQLRRYRPQDEVKCESYWPAQTLLELGNAGRVHEEGSEDPGSEADSG